MTDLQPPVADRRPVELTFHGDTRIDEYGWVADKKGRKLSMTLTVALAAAGSLVIGLSPSYALIGVGASIANWADASSASNS